VTQIPRRKPNLYIKQPAPYKYSRRSKEKVIQFLRVLGMSSFLEFVNDDVGLSDEFLLSPFNSASDCPDFFPPPSYETTFAQTNRGTTKLNLAQFASIDTDWHSLFSVTPISTICSSGATVSSVKPATKPDTSALKAPRR